MSFALKNYLPRGLMGRALFILVLPVVTLQLVVSLIIIQRHFDGVTRQMSATVRLEVSWLMREINAAETEAKAQATARRMASGLAIAVTLPSPGEPPTTDQRNWWDLSGREVGTTLHAGLPALKAVDLLSNSRQVRLWLQTRHGMMRVDVPRVRITASNPHQLLVISVLAAVLMTAVAYLFLRNQLVPINRLAEAASAFGRGQTMPYRPRGALEVRAAGKAFLDMRARIERQIEQRTLMLSGVSHDLRGPITRLKLGLSLLPEDEEVEALQADVVAMERLVEEFLSFARGDALDDPVEIDPAAFLRDLVERGQRRGEAVEIGTLAEVGPMRLRATAIERAVGNLIGNGLRHGRHVRVSSVATMRALRIIVEDDGPGIPEARREEALQPFARLDAARDPNHGGGVGLGLSIAADVARSHGGELRLAASESLGGLRAELVLAR
jgi:two-component system osmolarity sensor histidine kinase EnvZ